MTATDRLLAHNRAWAESFASRPPATTERRVAVVACMDARLDVYAILGLREVSQRAGEVILTGRAEDASAGSTARPGSSSGTLRRAPSRR